MHFGALFIHITYCLSLLELTFNRATAKVVDINKNKMYDTKSNKNEIPMEFDYVHE